MGLELQGSFSIKILGDLLLFLPEMLLKSVHWEKQKTLMHNAVLLWMVPKILIENGEFLAENGEIRYCLY